MSDRIFKARIILVILITVGLVAACKNKKGEGEKNIEAKTPVTLTKPVIKNISETVEFQAVTSYVRKNIIRSSTTGLVENVMVVPGDIVSSNKLLFTIRTREAAALQSAFKNDSSLLFKGIIKVFSPESGVVSSVSHQSGDYVQEGDELAVLSDQNSMVFILDVPAEQISLIEKTKECSLKLPDNKIIQGKITGRLPEMNVQTQTVSYIVKTVEPLHLPQNMIVVASIVKSIKSNAIVLPKAAVLGNEALTEFWVMKLINDTTAVRVPVRKGIETEGEIEIIEPAFFPGDRILLTGNYGLADTASVTVNK